MIALEYGGEPAYEALLPLSFLRVCSHRLVFGFFQSFQTPAIPGTASMNDF